MLESVLFSTTSEWQYELWPTFLPYLYIRYSIFIRRCPPLLPLNKSTKVSPVGPSAPVLSLQERAVKPEPDSTLALKSIMICVEFSTDIQQILRWGQRMGVDLREPKQLTEPYAWSQCHLRSMMELLVEFHGCRQADVSDNRMLFALVCDPYAWRIGKVCETTPPRSRIELPINASSFFSPERRSQWEKVFHGPLWDSIGHSNISGCNVARSLLNFLQCLLPGMFIIAEVHNGRTTQRGIPPFQWVLEYKEVLVSCIGLERYGALCKAAADSRKVFEDSPNIVSSGRG